MSMAVVTLAVVFMQLSLLSFGGTNSVIPEMQRQVVQVHGWLTAGEFASLFALAQAAPGPNMLVVTLIGWRVAALPGALVTTLGVAGPSSVLTFFGYRMWYRFRDAKWRRLVQRGLLPVTVGLLMASAALLMRHHVAAAGNRSDHRDRSPAVPVHSHPPAADPGDSGGVRGVRAPDIGSVSDRPQAPPAAAADGVLVPAPVAVPFRRPLLVPAMEGCVPRVPIPDGSSAGIAGRRVGVRGNGVAAEARARSRRGGADRPGTHGAGGAAARAGACTRRPLGKR